MEQQIFYIRFGEHCTTEIQIKLHLVLQLRPNLGHILTNAVEST